MGEVFLAVQHGPQGFRRNVAIKQVRPEVLASPDTLTMFLQEARLCARLSHPNIVQVYYVGEEKQAYFIAMEYIVGWELREVCEAASTSGVPIPVEVACFIASEVCSALVAAHEAVDENNAPTPIVHRDVSPSNIMISKAGIVKLMDFGIATEEGSLVETRPGAIKGKVSYLPPDKFTKGHDPLDVRQDVYSLGVVLYEVLSGAELFTGTNVLAVMNSIMGPVDLISSTRQDVSEELGLIVERAMASSPHDRFQSARDFRSVLRPFCGGIEQSDLELWLSELFANGESTLSNSDFMSDDPSYRETVYPKSE